MASASTFSPTSLFLNFISIGWLGVNLFLVLSGFCLFLPLVRRQEPRQIKLDLPEFARRRTHRILPPYYIALTILVILETVPLFRLAQPVLGVTKGAKDVILHFLMMQNLQAYTIGSINGVFWSLALEFQLYIVFPLLVLTGRKVGIVSMAALTLALSLLSQYLAYHSVGMETPTYTVLFNSLPSRCFEFAMGMTAAVLVTRPYPKQARIALAAAFLLLPFGLWSALHVSTVPMLMTQTWGIIFACCLIVGSRIPHQWFHRRGLADLTFLGTVSYSVYLVHVPFFELIHYTRFHLNLSGGRLIAFDFLRLLLAIGVGCLFYLVAERPFINREKKRSLAIKAKAS